MHWTIMRHKTHSLLKVGWSVYLVCFLGCEFHDDLYRREKRVIGIQYKTPYALHGLLTCKSSCFTFRWIFFVFVLVTSFQRLWVPWVSIFPSQNDIHADGTLMCASSALITNSTAWHAMWFRASQAYCYAPAWVWHTPVAWHIQIPFHLIEFETSVSFLTLVPPYLWALCETSLGKWCASGARFKHRFCWMWRIFRTRAGRPLCPRTLDV